MPGGGEEDGRTLAERLVGTGLVDPAWVAAQAGLDVADPLASARTALAAGLSPHPLLEPAWLPGDDGPEAALVEFLDDPARAAGHPLVDPAVVRRQLGTPSGAPDPTLLDWLATAGPDTLLPTTRLPAPVAWGAYRDAAVAAAHRWRHGGPAPTPAPARATTVVLPLPVGPPRFLQWLATTSDPSVGLVVVCVDPPRPARLLAGTLSALLPGTRVLDLPTGTAPHAALNAGAAGAGDQAIVLVRGALHPPTTPLAGILEVLSHDVAVAQPLVLDAHRLVQSAGMVVTEDGPTLLLAGHPAADAVRLGTTAVPAVAAGVVAVRRDAFESLGGLDETLPPPFSEADLALRARERGLGGSVVVPSVVVRNDGQYGAPRPTRAGAAALTTRHQLTATDLAPVLAPAGLAPAEGHGGRLRSLLGVHEQPPRLRWAVDIAAPAGPHGDAWGDTAFAHSLAQALERLGQHVAVDHASARGRSSRHLDDVVVVLRGLDDVVPGPGPLSVQWIISHPDEVDGDELARHDLRYAASHAWAESATRRWGLRVAPLLQCTDPGRFHPDRAAAGTGPDVLFVGNSRGVLRPVVRDALAAGADLTLYGRYWEEFVPAGLVAGEHVPNAELGALYASAGIVLADHYDDMRREGFWANRLFDAAACGARVLSDAVAGPSDVFGGLVQVYETPDDLRRLLRGVDKAWPDAATREAVGRRVGAEHSFDARARTLLDDVVRALRSRKADAPAR